MTWQEKLIKILDCQSDDLFELAVMAGYDPVDFYQSADFRGVALKASEVRALQLKSSNLIGAEIIEDDLDPDRDAAAKQLFLELISAGNFAQTHSIVARLLRLAPYSGASIDLYMDAVESNNQVSWIMDDLDLVDLAAKVDSSPSVQYSQERLDRLRRVRSEFGPGRE